MGVDASPGSRRVITRTRHNPRVSEPSPTRTRRRPYVLGVIACACVFVALSPWLAMPLATHAPAVIAWPIDTLASLAPMTALAIMVIAVIAAALRRFRVAAIIALAALVAPSVLLMRPSLPSASGDETSRTLDVLTINTNPQRENLAELEQVMLRAEDTRPDVVIVVECSATIVRSIRQGGPIRDAYPHTLDRGPVSHVGGYVFILAREGITLEDIAPETAGVLSVIGARANIEHPDGTTDHFGVVALHATSPKSPGRWASGHAVAERAGLLAGRLAAEGMPVIVAGDLNANRSSTREHTLTEFARLRRAKPLLTTGTYPNALPMIAIDGVWATPGVECAAWETPAFNASDHRPVRTRLVLPEPTGASQ